MTPDWQEIRGEFPALSKWTHLNTATFGQLCRRTTEAVAQHFARRDEFACWDFVSWYDDADRIRAAIARLIHCDGDDITFVPNAATALAMLLNGLPWKAGDRIVTLEHEFPNNLYGPHLLQRLGVETVEVEWKRFYDAIDPRTRLVVLSSANYTTGFIPPLEEIGAFLRQRGVLFYVDGTQSVGGLRFDCSRVQPDVLAVHAYKWLLSPTGSGFAYISPQLRRQLAPTVVGWRSHSDWRNVDQLHHGVPEFAERAEKYEGGAISFPLVYALGASVDMMLEIGPDIIEARVLELADQVRASVQRAGGEPVSANSHIVTARFENRDPSQMARALKDRGILVAARRGLLRISPHFYNNEEDIARLEAALR